MTHPYMLLRKGSRDRKGAINGTPVIEEITDQPPRPETVPEAPEAPTEATKTKKTLVRWKKDEVELLARAARDIRAKDLSLTHLEAVRMAQARALPPHRQRELRQHREVAEVVKAIRDLASLDYVGAKREAKEAEPALDAVESLAATGFDPTNVAAEIVEPASTKERRALVRWNPEERRKIAIESKRLLNGFADMSKVEAIRKAIEYTMPAGRQRDISSLFQVPWITDEWKIVDELDRSEREEREAREQAAEAGRVAEESRRAIEAARAEAEKAKAIDPASLPFDTLIEAIGVKVAGMLLRSIGEQLQESIMQRITEALGHMAAPAPLPEGVTRLHAAPRHRKPRVLIVGLLNQQEQDMTKAMGEFLSLDYAKSEHHTTLEDKARNADLVVLMTKFISHKHQDIVQRVNEHIVYRNGGVSELKRWLTQWINGEVITAAA
ncbi:hypothetical protein ADU20_27200 [Burkholderia pseudomallei]|uniref:hypothetical protein n=1 Tax=Burkholderia pseudomallei TaxID=28450 RepID=UPI0006835DBF|nr:hypothetical protein [Burkholderia pseudomallei]KNA31017.1 hypothetical protein ADU20_27200 [Burkholderia pseudomallei]